MFKAVALVLFALLIAVASPTPASADVDSECHRVLVSVPHSNPNEPPAEPVGTTVCP